MERLAVRPGALVAIVLALALDLLVLREQLETAIGSAACFERAKYEMILCVAGPEV